MQARVNVAGQASTSRNDVLRSVLPCWGTRYAKAKEGDAKCLCYAVWVCCKFCPLGCVCELSNLYGSVASFACAICLGCLFVAW